MSKHNFKIRSLRIACLVVGIFISSLVVNQLKNDSRLNLNKEMEISYIHFTKMGLSTVNNGGYDNDDVVNSMSYETKKARDEGNIQVIKQRLKNYGVLGLTKHLTRKALSNYNDGTFGWGLEGSFYYQVYPSKGATSDLLRNFYYNDGNHFRVFKNITQGAWLVVLLLILGNVFTSNDGKDNGKIVAMLSLIGLFVFESIFETRSRYLFTYVPIFITVAMLGLGNILNKVESLKIHIVRKASK